jgi:hypothetical protein
MMIGTDAFTASFVETTALGVMMIGTDAFTASFVETTASGVVADKQYPVRPNTVNKIRGILFILFSLLP